MWTLAASAHVALGLLFTLLSYYPLLVLPPVLQLPLAFSLPLCPQSHIIYSRMRAVKSCILNETQADYNEAAAFPQELLFIRMESDDRRGSSLVLWFRGTWSWYGASALVSTSRRAHQEGRWELVQSIKGTGPAASIMIDGREHLL